MVVSRGWDIQESHWKGSVLETMHRKMEQWTSIRDQTIWGNLPSHHFMILSTVHLSARPTKKYLNISVSKFEWRKARLKDELGWLCPARPATTRAAKSRVCPGSTGHGDTNSSFYIGSTIARSVGNTRSPGPGWRLSRKLSSLGIPTCSHKLAQVCWRLDSPSPIMRMIPYLT